MNLQRRQCLRVAIGLAGAGVALPAFAGETLAWRQRALLGFGTTLWLKAAHADAGRVEQALDQAVGEIRRIERLMSLFDPHSALSQLNARGQLRRPAPELLQVLLLAQRVAAGSGGAFDPSMQPLWQLWSQAAAHGALPSPDAVERVRRRVDWRAIDASPTLIRLNRPGMALSLNGIAQGYASDRVKAVLQAHGIRHALIDTGETSLLGRSPAGRAWTFAIEDAAGNALGAPPVLVNDGRAVATSSDAHTCFSADHRHHHIMDPHTGYSPTHWASVTVLAASCTLADALTKVFFMLPPARIRTEARRWGVDVVLQDKAGRWLSTV